MILCGIQVISKYILEIRIHVQISLGIKICQCFVRIRWVFSPFTSNSWFHGLTITATCLSGVHVRSPFGKTVGYKMILCGIQVVPKHILEIRIHVQISLGIKICQCFVRIRRVFSPFTSSSWFHGLTITATCLSGVHVRSPFGKTVG